MSDVNVKLKTRQMWLRSLHSEWSKLDHFDGETVPRHLYAECVATWGPIGKGAKPYRTPYNGDTGVAARYSNPASAVEPLNGMGSAGVASAKGRKSKGPSLLDDLQGGGNGADTAKSAVDYARDIPGFNDSPAGQADDTRLAVMLNAEWGSVSGSVKERAEQLARRFMARAGIDPPASKWVLGQLEQFRELPNWSECKASQLTPYQFGRLLWTLWESAPKGTPDRQRRVLAAKIMLADLIDDGEEETPKPKRSRRRVEQPTEAAEATTEQPTEQQSS